MMGMVMFSFRFDPPSSIPTIDPIQYLLQSKQINIANVYEIALFYDQRMNELIQQRRTAAANYHFN